MNARRLLVVTYHFTRDDAVGSLRWAGITKYLARLGWKVSVVTAASPQGNPTGSSTHVESCRHLWTSYQLLCHLKRRLVGSLPNGSPVARPSGRLGLLHRLRLEISGLLTFPMDSTRGWVLRAALRSRSVIRRFRPHVVVSSGPPHSAHLAAGMAMIGSSARWLIDLRDPWARALAKARESDSGAHTCLAQALIPRLERLAFRAAHGVITNTVQHAKALAARYPDLAIACVPNGVDQECLPPRPQIRIQGWASRTSARCTLVAISRRSSRRFGSSWSAIRTLPLPVRSCASPAMPKLLMLLHSTKQSRRQDSSSRSRC